MTEAEKMSQSLCVCNRIIESQEWKSAKDVLLYSALPDEISLSVLQEDALANGKTVWLPVVDGESMRIHQYVEGKTQVGGKFMIEEPIDETPQLKPEEYVRISLAVIPGRVFSMDGDRLGRGKGYYDRFLAMYKGLTFGAAFDCQIYETVPTDEWDKKLDKVFVG